MANVGTATLSFASKILPPPIGATLTFRFIFAGLANKIREWLRPKRKRPIDANQLAHSVISDVIRLSEKPQKNEKNPAAVALGRLGGLKGGKARAEKLSPEQRTAIAKRAAAARWSSKKTG